MRTVFLLAFVRSLRQTELCPKWRSVNLRAQLRHEEKPLSELSSCKEVLYPCRSMTTSPRYESQQIPELSKTAQFDSKYVFTKIMLS